jgi:hypothetical protein
MRATAEQQHNAGIKLQEIADQCREINPALDQKLALNVAMMMNPNLAEKYLGYSVRHDAIDDGKRILMNYQVPR